MPSATALRVQIEAVLADRVPSALTPAPRILRPVAATGVGSVDELLEGGLPIGAITEITGPECSGRTSLALSFIARATQAAKICAWIDLFDALHPESAAAAGVDLSRLLWVRCGVSRRPTGKPWPGIEQALRATDLLLQAGGLSAIVLDMGSLAPEHASRIPLATWFRYRAAAERGQTSILLLTQYACAKSSAGLALRMEPGAVIEKGGTVFCGTEHCLAVARQRVTPVSLGKPPQSEKHASWQSRAIWASCR
jgi:recombination protein RecA